CSSSSTARPATPCRASAEPPVTFEIHAEGVDVEQVMREIRATLEEKKRAGLLTDEEVREVASRPLRPVLQPHDLKSGLLSELLEQPSRWNSGFETASIYRTTPGGP